MSALTARALWLALCEVLAFFWALHPRQLARRFYRELHR